MVICQEIEISRGYKFAQSAVIWFDSHAKEEYDPSKGQYETTWYMPKIYSSGSSISASYYNEYFEISDSGIFTRGNISDNNIYVKLTAIKFKM